MVNYTAEEHAARMAAFRKTWQHRVITAAGAQTPLGMALRSAIFGTELEQALGAYPLVLSGDIAVQDGDYYVAMVLCDGVNPPRREAIGKLDDFRTALGRAMDRAHLEQQERNELEAFVRRWIQFDERSDEDRKALEVRAKLPKIGRYVYDRKEGWIPEPVAPKP